MRRFLAVLTLAGIIGSKTVADEWMRFRGPNGSGVAHDANIPTQWSDDEHLAWKAELPGPGSSSPIIVGDLVLVTCYTGYGVDGGRSGRVADLKRHLIAFDVATGVKQWQATVDGPADEVPYSRMLGEHGYASSTPVSDGQRIFVFFGKAGVLAYDLAGHELWQRDVGHESGPQEWGSGASPILHDNLVIVNASEESSALIALNQETGKEVWRAEAEGLGGTWGTPILATTGDRTDVVIGVPSEFWGLNPNTGKLRWHCDALQDNTYCSSLVTDGDRVYGIEGRSGQAIAVKLGGEKDVTNTNIVWKARGQNRISTPVVYEGKLYSVSRGIAFCLDAETGQQIYQKRLAGRGDEPASDRGGRFGRGGFGGAGGQDYSSPIIVNGHIYFTQRSGVTHVWKTGSEFQPVARNRFESDESRFHGTPAAAHGKLWLRSDECLYCLANK